MLVAAVVNLHGDHHRGKARGGPSHLSQQEVIARAVAFLGHNGRCAEYHHQSDKYQDQGDGKQPAIDAYTLGHGEFISPRRRGAAEQNVCEFPGWNVTILIPRGKLPMWARASRSCSSCQRLRGDSRPRLSGGAMLCVSSLKAVELRSTGQPGRLSPRVIPEKHERGARAYIAARACTASLNTLPR